MTQLNDMCVSLDTQAISVANNLHDELHWLIDMIRKRHGNKVAVTLYIQLIREARSVLDSLEVDHG